MKKNLRMLCYSWVALLFGSCSKTDYLDTDAGNRPPLTANIRFVNARTADVGIHAWTFTQQVTTTPVARNTASPYLTTTFGNVQINITEGNSTGYKASRQFGNSATYSAAGGPNGPIAGYYHTVFAAPARQDPAKDTLILFYDDLTAPPPGQAKLRFVHLASGVPELRVRLLEKEPTLLHDRIAYGQAGGSTLTGSRWQLGPFINVNAGTLSLAVTLAKDNTPWPIAQDALSHLELESGKIYTVFLYGTVGATGAAVIKH
ncbi:DUF4397 domain-containing protein [Chitinophaga nivalis]|uniref:DUF4397 domain-containing protein n=1 Tax=Chitinophaga nivalis TaxID=2991709 RepID=A0ABT3IM60_9BACT|nr:DUF4397 domain-containing protein [Chitinophaga nivalis]MCW3465257.1 DUF4397 domain-containing protein [Chitinophaga nivalis]MCW3485051.1 DUF4397 domain-containing protein [Chitinophaga nivalis]